MTEAGTITGADKETLSQKALRAHQEAVEYLKQNGWTTRITGVYTRPRPKKLAEGKQQDDGVDVVNFSQRSEHPGAHYLGRVYVNKSGDTITDETEYTQAIIDYQAKAKQIADKHSLTGKIPVPGQTQARPNEQPPAQAQPPTQQAPSQAQPQQQPQAQAHEGGHGCAGGCEAKARLADALGEPEIATKVMPGVLVVVKDGKVSVTLLKPGETVTVEALK